MEPDIGELYLTHKPAFEAVARYLLIILLNNGTYLVSAVTLLSRVVDPYPELFATKDPDQ
jgi:hypothetical protein